MPIYAFGATPEGIIRAPAQIYTGPSYDDTRVAFHSWTHTVLHTDGGLLELPDKLISPTKAEVVGTDKPLALLQEGRLRILPSTQGGEWDAVAITDAGPALGVRAGGVYALPSLVSAGFRLEHPLLRGSPRTSGPVAPITVVATESRAAILAGGEVLEAIWDWRHPGAPRLEVVEELYDFGQLGQGHTRAVEGWVRVTLPPARRVFAGRFSAVVECVE
ncbi:hypothetical protein CspeluHIS016_0309330 [Cutaneotrichosporon spelunceum]|uniref:Uncharacterized protein n=1 Tax=Cutaneotrichosporon spelunceum TaxID=1672016 RepID=A0AAD3TUZ6_9TREE|nr:hypothetical protein CspeluHIS016_0309330 [Cutaneotrichosporon spelunceum]